MIVALDGKILVDLSIEEIIESFRIPTHPNITKMTKEQGKKIYEQGPKKCLNIINEHWMKKPTSSIVKMPKNI